MKKLLVFGFLCTLAPFAWAVPILVEDTADNFVVAFHHDDFFGAISPAGAADGRTVSMTSGGESAAIAISIVFRDSAGGLEDVIFVFETISDDDIFGSPGEHDPGTVLVFDSADDFAGIDPGDVTGDGLMLGFSRTIVTVVVGDDRDTNAFSAATLRLTNVPEPGPLGLLGIGLLGLGWARKRLK